MADHEEVTKKRKCADRAAPGGETKEKAKAKTYTLLQLISLPRAIDHCSNIVTYYIDDAFLRRHYHKGKNWEDLLDDDDFRMGIALLCEVAWEPCYQSHAHKCSLFTAFMRQYCQNTKKPTGGWVSNSTLVLDLIRNMGTDSIDGPVTISGHYIVDRPHEGARWFDEDAKEFRQSTSSSASDDDSDRDNDNDDADTK